MNSLALHVTEAQGSVALERDDGVVLASEFAAQGDKAPVLLQEIARLIARAEITPEALGVIAVTTGPGSFTGIRVGLATAQGLAMARGGRVFACDSLQPVAAAHRSGKTPVAVVLDARRGEVYAAMYDLPTAGPLQVRLAPRCVAPEVAADAIAIASGGETFSLVGSGAFLVAPALLAAGVEAQSAPRTAGPVAVVLLDLIRRRAVAPVPAADLEPVYLRLSDAEVRRSQDA